jgi:hypothetical protein
VSNNEERRMHILGENVQMWGYRTTPGDGKQHAG